MREAFYCESYAFTVKIYISACTSPLTGQPAQMHKKFPCRLYFL